MIAETGLLRYDIACRALADARSIDEVKDVRDKAEALRLYGRQAKNKDLELAAAEIRLRAERRLGEMLSATDRHEGGQPKTGSDAEPVWTAPRLADLGIDKKHSSRVQKIAAVPSDRFEAEIATWRERVSRGNERVTMDLIHEGDKAERRAARERELAGGQLALPDARYGVILADPEWRFEPWSRITGVDRAADNHYPTSPTDVIAARPVAKIAADDCVLFLWATAPMLPQALHVMIAWGFSYRSNFVWVKPTPGTGYRNRNRREHLLVGVRGDVPAPPPSFAQWRMIADKPVRRPPSQVQP
jgi:hypothetical protein